MDATASPSLRPQHEDHGRWRFRIRLRTLLVAVTVLCFLCAYVAQQFRTERVAANSLLKAGALVDWELYSPAWLRKLCGFDPFARVKEVSFIDEPVVDRDLRHLQFLPKLREIYIAQNSTFSGTGLRHLAGLNNLTTIYIYDVPLTDAGLRTLPSLPKLERLYVLATAITDDGIKHLRQFSHVKEMQLGSARLSEEAVSRLGAQLPNTQVSWSGQGYAP